MKLLAICGSPREHGNTEHYLNTVLEEARKLGPKPASSGWAIRTSRAAKAATAV